MKKKYIEKLFYGVYPYKITLSSYINHNYEKYVLQAHLDYFGLTLEELRNKAIKIPERNVIIRWSNTMFQKDVMERLEDYASKVHGKTVDNLKKEKTFRIRREFDISIFMTNEEDYNNLQAVFSDLIREVHEPINKNHIDVLEDDVQVVVKESLFWGSYRYKILIKKKNSIRDQVATYFNQDGALFDVSEPIPACVCNDKIMITRNAFTDTIFVSNDSDFFIVKLMLSDYISINKCILQSEITE